MTSLAVPSSCVVTQTPMGTNSGTRRRKRKFPLLFVNCDRARIEIDHLYGLRCRGWYCNTEQHSLCRSARPQAAARRPAQLVLFRIAVPTTPAQTVSWSIPIVKHEMNFIFNTLTYMTQAFVRIYFWSGVPPTFYDKGIPYPDGVAIECLWSVDGVHYFHRPECTLRCHSNLMEWYWSGIGVA